MKGKKLLLLLLVALVVFYVGLDGVRDMAEIVFHALGQIAAVVLAGG